MSVILNPIKCYLLARLKDDKKREEKKNYLWNVWIIITLLIYFTDPEAEHNSPTLYVYHVYDITVNSARIFK